MDHQITVDSSASSVAKKGVELASPEMSVEGAAVVSRSRKQTLLRRWEELRQRRGVGPVSLRGRSAQLRGFLGRKHQHRRPSLRQRRRETRVFQRDRSEDGRSRRVEGDAESATGESTAQYEFVTEERAQLLIQQDIHAVISATQLNASLAAILLQAFQWDKERLLTAYQKDPRSTLEAARLVDSSRGMQSPSEAECEVCFMPASDLMSTEKFHGRDLTCGHAFCRECWKAHFINQIKEGHSTQIECMEGTCTLQVAESFVRAVIGEDSVAVDYEKNLFRSRIHRHRDLRFCVGCKLIAHRMPLAQEQFATRPHLRLRSAFPAAPSPSSSTQSPQSSPAPFPSAPDATVHCTCCSSRFCFECSGDHPGMSCEQHAKADAKQKHATNCPNCQTPIEKNGGCQYVHCTVCKEVFCYRCLKLKLACYDTACAPAGAPVRSAARKSRN